MKPLPFTNIIKAYHIFTILYVISITVSILPHMIAKTSYASVLLMLLSIILFIRRGSCLTYYNFSSIYTMLIPLLLLSYSLSGMTLFFEAGREGATGFGIFFPFAIIILFPVVLSNYVKRYGYNSLVRIYIGYCLYIAVTGLTASILINSGIVDFSSWQVNIGELTNGQIVRDRTGLQLEFSMPYYFGLVMTGSYEYDLFRSGITFFRATGFGSEPQYGGLLISPAFFLINKPFVPNRYVQYIIKSILVLFIVAVFSLTSIAGLLVLLPLYWLRKRRYFMLALCCIGIFALILFYWEASLYYGHTDVITSKIMALHRLTSLTPSDPPILILLSWYASQFTEYFSILSGHELLKAINSMLNFFIIVPLLIFGIRLTLSKKDYWIVGLGLLFILIFSLKNGFVGLCGTVIQYPIFIFFFWLTGYAITHSSMNTTPNLGKWRSGRSSRIEETPTGNSLRS